LVVKRRIVSGGGDTLFAVNSGTLATLSNRDDMQYAA